MTKFDEFGLPEPTKYPQMPKVIKMNERIKELADRLWRVHPSDIDAMGLKTRTEFYEHELKKFAELIVRECIEIVDSGYLIGPANQIKQHFGVEE